MYRLGMGDVLNPTAGTALDCGLFNFGVFKKECWCLDWPSLCSKDDYQAAMNMAHPENIVLPGPPILPVAPTGDALTVPPASGADAAALAQKLSDDAIRATQAQNAAAIAATQANIDRVGTEYDTATAWSLPGLPSFTVPTWVWIVGGLGVFGIVALGGGSSRRYGR